jgi:hypothetical protein
MSVNKYHEAQERIKKIKAELRSLGWTIRFGADSPMNHGPLHTRIQAEVLYQEWIKLDNPYAVNVGPVDEYHTYWAS